MIIWIMVLILISTITYGMAYYGNYTYGSGYYGTNTPPLVQEFQPSDLSPTFLVNSNITFNVSLIDWDGDAIKLEWFVNNNLNITNENMSYFFSTVGVYNVSINASDWMDQNLFQWSVSIVTTSSLINISDILIVPRFTQVGNLIIITANVTASENLTNVSAYLNTQGDFHYLEETPRNQTIGAVWSNNVTQVRWYVLVPLEPGKHETNVTYISNGNTRNGEQKNIVTEVEGGGMTLGVVILIPLFIAAFLLLVSRMIDPKNWAIKGFLMLVGFVFIFNAYQFSTVIVSEFYGSTDLIDAMGDSVNIYGTIFYVTLIVYILAVVWDITSGFFKKKHKTGDYND